MTTARGSISLPSTRESGQGPFFEAGLEGDEMLAFADFLPTTVGISGKQQKGCYKKMPQTVVVFYDKLEDAFINAAGGIGELDSSSSATVFF